MFEHCGKRVLALFLAMVMFFSAVPVQAFAEEYHDHEGEGLIDVFDEPAEDPVDLPEVLSEEADSVVSEETTEATTEETTEATSEEPTEASTEASTEAPAESGESEALIALRAEIAAYVEKLGITPDMPDVMLLYAYGNHASYEEAQASLTKQDEFIQKGMQLSEAEQKILLAEHNTKLCIRYREVVENAYATEVLANCTVNGVKFETTSSGASVSASGTTVTATVSGKDGSCGGSGTAATMDLYVTNTSEEAGVVSFTMTKTNVNSIKGADGEDISGMGSYSRTLAAGESFKITVTTGANSTQNKLVLTDIAFTPATQAFNVTVEYATASGSVTSSLEAISEDVDGVTTMTIADVTAADGVTLTANSSTFLCWVDKDNKLLSKDKIYTVKPAADTTVKALLNGNQAHFVVNGNLIYDDLNKAAQMAGTASNKTIVLMNNGTLPAGDYTIPSGVTLLIPFNDANTLHTTTPGTQEDLSYSTPKVYRKLTMAEGANITINGAMSLSAMTTSSNGQSSPVGNCSFVQMDSGSSITVNNGGKLYAWGFIQGSGSVTVKSGGTAYECFQLMDWRGGDNTSGMIGNSRRVFPMSQYYVQNIEVPMTLEAGATENGYMSVQITLVGIQGSDVPFIGTNGMFNITSGYIVKDYDENTGRLLIDMYGDLSVKSLSLSMKLGIIGSKTINSKDYVLPINGNMSVTMHNGSAVTMTQDIALQPGGRMIIEEGASCTLGSGNKIYVYDYDQWIKDSGDTYDEGKSFCGNGDATHVNLKYPTSATTVQGRTEDAYVEVNGTVDASAGFVYTTASGASVRGTGTIIMKPGTENVTYQVKSLGSDSKSITYYDIPITSAKLTNADGSIVETANDLGKVIYTSVNGVWTCAHSYAEGTYVLDVKDATCLADGLKTFSCNCGEDVKTEVIEQLEHEYDAVVTAPTCTEAGYTTHTCKNGCNDSYTDTTVNALGHDEVPHAAQAPTCTEIGWEEYVTCSRCDYTTYVEIAALGHKETTHAAQAPTCTEIGWEEYVTCSVCDYSTYVEIAAAGHNYNAVVTAPTCTEAGYTTYTCPACSDSYVADEVAAAGHDWQWVTDKDATILEPGVKHEECQRCGEVQNENTEIPMLKCSHEGTLTITEAKAATCTEVGNTRYSYCSACQNYYGDDFGQHEIEKDSWIQPAKGHDEVPHAAQTATCTEIGWEAYVTCSCCDYTTYAEIAALGHEEVAHEAQAPTCQAAGWDAYVTCANCDYTTKGEDLPADPDAHVWDEGEDYGNHSCNSDSYIKYNCTLCSETNYVVVREQHFRIPIAEEIPATCTEDGMTSGWKCEKCDEFWIAQEVIPALGHDWNGNLPCQSETSACARCDLAFETKQEHLAVVEAGYPATCTATGLTDGAHCGYCGEVLEVQTEIPMADHTWLVADMEIPATCNSVGHKEGARYCMDCDYDADPIPQLTHTWMHRDAKKATYSAIGWNAHDYCLLCNATKTLEQYESKPCEFCGENPEGYIEIPKVEVQRNETVEEFLTNIGYLEMMAEEYAKAHPGTDPLALVLNYLRTGVENYTSGSWAIMAGAEDKDFLKYVQEAEDAINSDPAIEVWVNVSGLKKIRGYANTHGELNVYTNSSLVTILDGHLFGTMDMTYHNKGSQNHADVGGWVGDLTDLLSTSDEFGVPANLTLDEKVEYIRDHYLFKTNVAGSAGSFGHNDLYSDLDGYYFMNELITKGYNTGDLEKLMREYFQTGLTLKQRFSYLMTNRLDGLSTRKDLRTAVYNAYTSNKLITTLEGTRNFNTSGNELAELRKAVCYAFADEMCRIAGDYVEDLTNPRFTVFDTETKILAPGVSQQINYATNADGKQIVYYVATADVAREDVGMWVNYYDRDPGTPENPQWKNNSVPSSAQNAQDRYGDPASEDYIENFNVIASTNAGGYDMSDVATPGGLMVMNGVEWHPQTNTAGFFAILSDGTAYMGTHDEYRSMMDAGLIQEAIGGFGEFVVQNGQVTGNATYSDAPRTSVGITATGRVVLMCIDGRQAPFSSGASLQDVGYIMKEAGCVVAINLDGGGSTTFVARQPGSDELTVMNRPSDGYPRNVSTNLLIYSTAPSSTKFDHAVIESEYDYATIGSAVQMTAAGVSPAGNAVDVPEGATWTVSDESWAEITADGIFTGKRLGEVYVYLMLDGQVIGSKLITLTNADQLYFEKAKVDVIYGSSVNLPLRARYEGKPIAINSNDVTITLSVPAAGSMDGFAFVAAESAVKSVSITAALNENAKASINVMLYKQGENSFDFDKATGGDRMLAWHREVSNSKVEDGNIYNVIDPSKDMVTSYTFAMDMTTIPIPERLDELTYMLPGGTVEGTNAWTFLLSLAQRISDMSWVKATIEFDDRFVVDYSELNILNEYFQMKSLEFDETTNTLTVTMGWIKQSQVIDEATASPLCLIKGLKLTPKSGAWEDVTKIDAVTSGNISYEIYMRASGLYSFAQKPESQAVFGIYPYRNPADTSEAGGYFYDTYAEITDTFTLVNVLKEGWVNEDGGFAYYVNGERLTGIQKVEDFYYDFGENGVNVGQSKFTGMFFDEAANTYHYSYIGELASGWQSINGEWYYFSGSTMAAVSGRVRLGGVYYDFEENGKLVSGVWVNTLGGIRYYYGPSYHANYWLEVDNEWYYFKNGYLLTGVQRVRSMENSAIKKIYDFGEDGICRGVLEDGLHFVDGNLYYLIDGASQRGLHQVDGDYYFFTWDGPAVISGEHYAWETHCDLPCSTYAFGADGKMINGIAEMSDGIYYYVNGKVDYRIAGLHKIGDDYYFVNSVGKCVTGQYYAWATFCDLPCGNYEFGPDGKMIHGLVQKDDGVYYYTNGKVDYKIAGLHKFGDDYYFVSSSGKCVTGQYYAWATFCDLPCGNYEFASDGKMLQGLVQKDDGIYYYVNGKVDYRIAGLHKIGDDYYFVNSLGKCVTGQYYAWATFCDLPCGNYEFGSDGKMLQGLVQKDNGLYYYVNGKLDYKYAGLHKIGDDYYFVNSAGKCVTGTYDCWATFCDLPLGVYEFGTDGKMLHGFVEKEDGLYCYVYGRLGGNAGLIKLGEDYYFINSQGKCVTGKYYCWETKCDLPVGNYEFGPDGKMYNGFVTKDDGIYYYVQGKVGTVGLNYIDGYYYFINYSGKLVTNQQFYVWETNGLLLETTYTFDANGRIIA